MTTQESSVDILGVAMATPLGLESRATPAAVEAGITRFRETTVDGADDEPIRASFRPTEAPGGSRQDRLVAYGRHALDEIGSRVARLAIVSRSHDRSPGIPVYLGLPEPTLGVPLDVSSVIEELNASARGVMLDFAPERTYASGRASLFEAPPRAIGSVRGQERLPSWEPPTRCATRSRSSASRARAARWERTIETGSFPVKGPRLPWSPRATSVGLIPCPRLVFSPV
jgi:hypothetical protein